MTRYPASDPASPLIVLGHGAGAGEQSGWMRDVGKGLSARGISVVTFDFPYMAAGRKVPDKGAVLEDAFAAIWTEAVRGAASDRIFAGGKSMGGRISSQTAARSLFQPPPAGLVFFGYPLHPPGKPEQRRDRHLPQIAAPMLFLHGTRDPFGSPDEMTALTGALQRAELHVVDGGDHSLTRRSRKDGPDPLLVSALDAAALWIHAQVNGAMRQWGNEAMRQ